MNEPSNRTRQQQFLEVIDRAEADRRFHAALRLEPLGSESIDLEHALGRVLAEDVLSPVDVPSFDRSNFDGFAVRAVDTFGAEETTPRQLQLLGEVITAGCPSRGTVTRGTAMAIATGGTIPRGADAIVMVEYTDSAGEQLEVRRAATPGFGVAFAGTDIARGETVLRRGQRLTSRETGVLAAIGVRHVAVWRQPRVAILSTGNEIVEPGHPLQPGQVYDSNSWVLADAVRECGAVPFRLGIFPDDADRLRSAIRGALREYDVVLLSGGTSKGAGDVACRVVRELDDPGIVAHGVALKPGKPVCLAVSGGRPLAVLPGFPTSAIFTFHEFLAPVLRHFAGRNAAPPNRTTARLATQLNSVVGRTEYLLVGLTPRTAVDGELEDQPRLAAYPVGKGSGSVTTFSRADGFVTIDRHTELVPAGSTVSVQLLGNDLPLADLTVIGSHCIGLDWLLGRLQQQGFQTKFLAVGSTAGLAAAQQGDCDLAGIHLLDAETGSYNSPFVTEDLYLQNGYRRLQGVVFRPGDRLWEGRTAAAAIEEASRQEDCLMINRNQGSGTRILIDRLLRGRQPTGYSVQAHNHHAVAAAVAQGRADWGIAIQTVAELNDLGFLPVQQEHYDFVIPRARRDRPAVRAFCELLSCPNVARWLSDHGFELI